MAIYILFAFIIGVVSALVGVHYYPDVLTTGTDPDGLVMEESEAPEAPASTTEQVTTTGKEVIVYDGIAVSEMAQVLDLSGRGLTGSLKAEVRMLPQLQVLDLSGNQFTGIPAEIGQLRALRVLNLSNNDLTGLPHELGNLQQLTLLDVRGNAVSNGDMEIIAAKLPTTTEILR